MTPYLLHFLLFDILYSTFNIHLVSVLGLLSSQLTIHQSLTNGAYTKSIGISPE
jgi:hypothetical protein